MLLYPRKINVANLSEQTLSETLLGQTLFKKVMARNGAYHTVFSLLDEAKPSL